MPLTLDQNRFLAVRLMYPSDHDAALACGIHPKTVSGWKCELPAFRRAYESLGLDARREAVRCIQRLFEKAIARLSEGLDDSNARTRARYIELVFAFGGLARAADVNVNVVDRTRILLQQIREAAKAVTEGDSISSGVVDMDEGAG